MWKALQRGWKPPTAVSREQYFDIKYNISKYPEELVGFVGFLCSFGTKWFNGYAFNKEGRNYAQKGYNALMKQIPTLKDVVFTNFNYVDLNIDELIKLGGGEPENTVIYCDPPYQNTTSYSNTFNHSHFWNWIRNQKSKGYTIYVSEYAAPSDFKCIFKKNITSTLDRNKKYQRIEKLFTL